jgi:heat shock protein HtpX
MITPAPYKRRNIYEQQAHNKHMTWLCVSSLMLTFLLFGLWLDLELWSLSLSSTRIPYFVAPIILGIMAYTLCSFVNTIRGRVWYGRMENVEEEQKQWTRQLVVFGFGLFALFIYLGIVEYSYLFNRRSTLFSTLYVGNTFPLITLLGGGMGLIYVIVGFRNGSDMIIQSFRARPLNEENNEEHILGHIVEEMSLAAGLHTPGVYVVKDVTPNAFTVGMDPSDSSILVTTGLLRLLNRYELQGVIAHEMSHLRNHDVRLMTVVSVLYGSILLFADWSRRDLSMGGMLVRRRLPRIRGAGGAVVFIPALIASLLAPLIARLLAMGISRQREYLADASAAELTRYPSPLADALKKMEGDSRIANYAYRSVAHLCVVDPMNRHYTQRNGFLAEWFSTHPPTRNRIMLLDALTLRYRASGELDENRPTDETDPTWMM